MGDYMRSSSPTGMLKSQLGSFSEAVSVFRGAVLDDISRRKVCSGSGVLLNETPLPAYDEFSRSSALLLR